MRQDTTSRYDGFVFGLNRKRELWRGHWLRLVGVQAGYRFGVGPGVRVLYPRCLTVGHNVTIEGPAYLHCLSAIGVHIGDRSNIEHNFYLHCGGTLGDHSHGFFRLGDNSFIGPNAVMGAGGGIVIGNGVLFGPNVIVSSENHNIDDLQLPIREQGVSRKGVVIEDECWIASRAVILDGVRLGAGSVVAAGAVVVRDVPPNAIVGGVPAKVLRYRGVKDAASPDIDPTTVEGGSR